MGFSLFIFSACEYDGPTSAWEEIDKDYEDLKLSRPVISSVLPEEAGSASEITIIGEHFSPVFNENNVYFDNIKATLKMASDTVLIVFRPNTIGDSLTIKVSVNSAIAIAKYFPYKLDTVVIDFGILLKTDAISAIAMDLDENLYASMEGFSVVKFKPDGKRDETYVATTDPFTPWDMKIGAGGSLYFLYGRDKLKRIGPDGGSAETFANFRSLGRPKLKYFDFDQYGNLYAGGNGTGLFLADSSGSEESLGFYENYDLSSIRVFDGYIYVTGDSLDENGVVQFSGIWKNQILSEDGEIGPSELLLDWANSGEYSNVAIKAITFSHEGDLYIATDDDNSPIIVFTQEGEIVPLFYGIINPPVDQFVWGNGNFLYANINRRISINAGGRLIRINVGRPGAPYYGRQ